MAKDQHDKALSLTMLPVRSQEPLPSLSPSTDVCVVMMSLLCFSAEHQELARDFHTSDFPLGFA